jgi:S-adenosylmethionine:tRNA ribosyltransferase-isomerase
VSLPTHLFDYELPAELIAQSPASRRDESRLLVVRRREHSTEQAHFSDLPKYLGKGDRLFRNNAAVIPARLGGVRPTGGKVECFLLAPTSDANVWRCLLRPARKLPAGARFGGERGSFSAEVVERGVEGESLVRFDLSPPDTVLSLAERHGHIPLPPYIARADVAADRDRYQTVYADKGQAVAVAAPTAGLHFTNELLAQLAAQGVGFHNLTLHVGMGTFKPIATDTVEAHPIHREIYEVPVETQQALFTKPPPPGRRVAVGTTAVRSIEDFLRKHPAPLEAPFCGESALYLYPPAEFLGVDALITNFHLPRSTLLCLVSAFLSPGSESGIGWLREIYAEAIAARYRFLSYGDAMLIL